MSTALLGCLFGAVGWGWCHLRLPLPQTRPRNSLIRGAKDEIPQSVRGRAMVLLSNLGRDNDLKRRGWYAVWCYTPSVRKRTVYHWKETMPVVSWAEQQSRGVAREVAVMNGGYFEMYEPHKPTRKALIGSAGNGKAGKWSDGSPPSRYGQQFQRWAFGMQPTFNGASDFALELMEKSADGSFHVPHAIEANYPFGLSGLMCLIRSGVPMVWNEGAKVKAFPAGQWPGSDEWGAGYYRRAALAWTGDGKHLFMVVNQHPRSVLETRDLFARYQDKRYLGPGPILTALRHAWKVMPPSERPCAESELPTRIDNAVLLDGGHSATVVYRRTLDKKHWQQGGGWLSGAPWRPNKPPVPTMIEAIASQ